jgi:hypothetical protein
MGLDEQRHQGVALEEFGQLFEATRLVGYDMAAHSAGLPCPVTDRNDWLDGPALASREAETV